MSFTYSLYDDLHSFWIDFCSWRYRSQSFFFPVLRYLLNALCFRLDSRRIFRLHQGWLYLVEVCLDGTCFLRLSRQMVLTSDHRLFIGVVISEQSINLSKETFTVCVFVRHLFSFYPFYFDFHSARINFDVSSGFYLWNINKTTAWHL
jgi:hypothetical protein